MEMLRRRRTKSKASKGSRSANSSEAEAMTQYANEDTSSTSSEVASDERKMENAVQPRSANSFPTGMWQKPMDSKDENSF
ncbi:hypothetical protein QR680_008215 [Steinernema hermaphroditum]|uniref:Uncharacterized protein n=1 Tax=Steinernema hermaphroditum TaxID=289476 RepID=A0AA39M7H0_9BILA|nr:hypothetical protein QR680_008215 [Steinernema hermaphroditum]